MAMKAVEMEDENSQMGKKIFINKKCKGKLYIRLKWDIISTTICIFSPLPKYQGYKLSKDFKCQFYFFFNYISHCFSFPSAPVGFRQRHHSNALVQTLCLDVANTRAVGLWCCQIFPFR